MLRLACAGNSNEAVRARHTGETEGRTVLGIPSYQLLGSLLILHRVQADLRASVFAVINNETSQTVGSEQREWLLSTEEGVTVAALVAEFLEWAELKHTARVFEAEFDFEEHFANRADLAEQLVSTHWSYRCLEESRRPATPTASACQCRC